MSTSLTPTTSSDPTDNYSQVFLLNYIVYSLRDFYAPLEEAYMTPLAQLDDPTDFNSTFLQSLDSSLRCQICHELFTAPVILTNCSHTFDSLCLRNHFKLSKKCPQCQVEANEDRIRRNLIVEELVNNWYKARPDLIALQQSTLPSPAPIPSTSRSPLPPPPPPSSSSTSTKRRMIPTHSKLKSQPPRGSISLIDEDEKEKEEDASSDVEVIDDPGLPNRKRPRKESNGNGRESSTDKKGKGKQPGGGVGRVKFEATLQEGTKGGDPTDPSILVSCPLCQKQVKNGVISSHIDSNCKKFLNSNSSNAINTRSNSGVFGRMMGSSTSSTGGSEKMNSNSNGDESSGVAEQDSMKYLPLPNYAHKKLRDLESLLRALNLPLTVPSQHARTTASKIEYLKRRHSQYLTLWNSNVDLGDKDPRRVGPGELRKRLNEWEKVLDKEERGKEKEKDKETAGGGTDKEYIKSHENEFKDLIAQARISHEKNKNKIKMKQVETSEIEGSETIEAGEMQEEESVREGEEPDSTIEGEGARGTSSMEGVEMTGEEGSRIEIETKVEETTSNDQDQDTTLKRTDPLSAHIPNPVSSPRPSSPTISSALSPIRVQSPKPTSRSKQVRILTPPPPPPLSPIATPPPLAASGVEGRERRDRSSSILEYDEKFFPPTSQRVREIDWEGIRRGREEQEEEGDDDEEEEGGELV